MQAKKLLAVGTLAAMLVLSVGSYVVAANGGGGGGSNEVGITQRTALECCKLRHDVGKASKGDVIGATNLKYCDLNHDGTKDAVELLKVHEKLDTNLTVTGNGSYAANIGYMMNGRVKGVGGSLTIDLLSIGSGTTAAKKVIVANSGRIRTAVVSP